MSKKIVAKKTTSKTHGVFILDKSGSMSGLRNNVVTAFNEQVQQLRIIAANQPTFASLVTFNGDVEEVRWKEDVKTFPEATVADYVPSGATALCDAMGYTLSKLQKEDDGDTSYLVIIQSDGETNSDRVFVDSAIRELVQSCEATERYTIVYIGCDASVIERVVHDLGLSVSNSAVMSTASGMAYGASMSALNSSLRCYAAARSSGDYTASVNFCSSEIGKMGNLTEADHLGLAVNNGSVTINGGTTVLAPGSILAKGSTLGVDGKS